MREVLISIQPKWCELIASGKKTVEVRKTKPKLETPFKVYIYCTADRRKHIADTFVPQTPLFVKNGMAKSSIGREDGLPWRLGNGKVIGEFVCDEIENLTERDLFDGMDEISNSRIENYSCVDIDELLRYKGSKNEIYGWHITDLVVYDEPRELRDFQLPCDHENDCGTCKRAIYCSSTRRFCRCDLEDGLKRPPQSWCYIEPRQTAD